jgi:MATE family multidrug resistance protein
MRALAKPNLREVLRISFPLILTALSGNLMFFLDRVILSHYSTDAMNAAAVAGMICSLFQFGGIAITSVAEVFVGQYNGSQQYDKIATPVWQMIWFAFSTFSIFLPMAIWGGPLFLKENILEHGLPYYKIIMYFGPMLPLITAISSFYIGQGKVKLITFSAFLANVINLGLNFVLVFGVEGFIPSYGVAGSATATVISQIIQFGLLFSIFLSKPNRKAFKTHKFQFNYKILKACLKIGTPAGVGHTLEMAAWSFILLMVTDKGSGYLTVQTIGSTVFILFAFFTDGLNKGVMAISSNIIGAGRWEFIPQLLKSSVKLQLIVVSILFIPLVLVPELIMDLFINRNPEILELPNALSPEDLRMVTYYTVRALQWVWIYCVFDGIVWIISGILTSAGDTRFIMFVNITSVWIFAVIPTYLALYYCDAEPSTPWLMSVFYTIFNLGFLYWRYRSNKWKKLVLRPSQHAA